MALADDLPPTEEFTGPVPRVKAKDRVWCRDALGRGWVKRVALGPPRYDRSSAYSLCWLTVPTATLEDYERHGLDAPFVNWPAKDVARTDQPVPGPISLLG